MKKIRLFTIILMLGIFLTSITGYASGVEDQRTRRLCNFGNVCTPNTNKACFRCKGHSYGQIYDLSKYGLDGELDYVHGMYYAAKTTSKLTAKSADSNPSSVKVKKGTNVIIIYFKSRKGNTICRLSNKRTVVIPAKKLKVQYYLYNSTSAYTDAQIEDFVKQHHITSKTDYMFFVSKFNQRGWILKKKNGEWVCKYKLGISTGAYTNGRLPNDIYGLNSLQINTHYINKKGFGKGISYASKNGGNQIHIGKTLHPFTHGCIAMSRKDYNFIYYYLPYKTRVVSF